MIRGFTGLVGVALLAATAHTTIAATGGYGGGHAVLTMAIALGVAAAALAIGGSWAARRRALASWLIATVIAGESFGFVLTAERLVAAREAAQAPLREAAAAHAKAAQRVAVAEARRAPATSTRLEVALVEKKTADEAATARAAERGCAANCRALLQARVDAAEREINAAREDLAEAAKTAQGELVAARVVLAAQAVPASATPLADRLGVPAWALDLLTAALGSMAANGLACGLIAFAAHGRRAETKNDHEANSTTIEHDSLSPPAAAAPVVTMEPEPAAISAPACVQRFAFDRLFPAQPDEGVDVAAIEAGIRRWCAQRQIASPAGAELGRAMGDLFADAGIRIEERDGRLIAMGVQLKVEQQALPAPGRHGAMHRRREAAA